ncbi:tetratricopeptide repeat protein [Methanothermobacter thermautotrophicus]|uniref:Tetratricopeptide repeat protein n=2 Tax=Methanothermobacter thermautotrophicus TaxID=145262 RepID=A0A842YJ62_METTF|nr:tetratricopeptide repeat protein [Methanothermobacter thermautotrophicus]
MEIGWRPGFMLLHLNLLSIFDSLRNDQSALRHYKKKLHEYQEHEAEVLIDIGVIYLDRGEIERAVKNFEEALETYRKLKFPEGVAYTSELLGDSLMALREFDNAMEHYSEALSIYSDLNPPLAEELREKIYEAGKIRETLVPQDPPEPESVEETSENHGLDSETLALFRFSDRLLEFIEGFEDYAVCWENRDIEALEESLKSATVIRDRPTEGLINLLIGRYHLEEGEIYDALKFIKRATRIFRDAGDSRGAAVALVMMGVILFIMDERENLYTVFKEALEIFRALEMGEAESVTMKIINTLSRM